MTKVKEMLGGHMCIAGNVPIALLSVGSADDVVDYCRNLIDAVGQDGGFILGPSGQTEDVKIENVEAMMECAKECG